MQEQSNAIKIAVVEEQIKGIREQQAAHAKDTRERFDEVGTKLDELLTALNKGRGAYAVLFLMSGVVGALLIKIFTLVVHWAKI